VGLNGTGVCYFDHPNPSHTQLNLGSRTEKMGIWLYDTEVEQPVRLTVSLDS